MVKGVRKKASDIFRETESTFGKKTTFEKTFPEVDDYIMQVIEDEVSWKKRGNGPFERVMGLVSPYPKTRNYSKSNNPGEFIDCTNKKCFNGGFSIGMVLRGMISNGLTRKEGKESCQGYEGSPNGKRKYGECTHSFSYVVEIKYKSKID